MVKKSRACQKVYGVGDALGCGEYYHPGFFTYLSMFLRKIVFSVLRYLVLICTSLTEEKMFVERNVRIYTRFE